MCCSDNCISISTDAASSYHKSGLHFTDSEPSPPKSLRDYRRWFLSQPTGLFCRPATLGGIGYLTTEYVQSVTVHTTWCKNTFGDKNRNDIFCIYVADGVYAPYFIKQLSKKQEFIVLFLYISNFFLFNFFTFFLAP